jgi:membrane associated rhomboid family serine protease
MTQFRPSRFQVLPPVIKNLLIINILVFIAQSTIDVQFDLRLEKWFALHTWQSPWFKPWQIVTHMFMHGDIGHIFFNMFALWMFGSVLENLWGAKRFVVFYFACGLGAALAHLIFMYYHFQPITELFKQLSSEEQFKLIDSPQFKLNESTLGASGAVFGCLAAFGYLFPNSELYIYGIIPVKAKWMVIGYAALELYLTFANSAGDNVAHIAHLGGAVVGFGLVYFWNKTNKKRFY